MSCFFFFSSRRRHTRCSRDWSSDVCSSDLAPGGWSQVAAARVKPGGRVIAIDLLKIAPITGVEVVAGDFRAARLEGVRSEEHTSELQSRLHLVCRLLLEKKKKKNKYNNRST